MGTAEIRKIASLCKSEFVNKVLVGKHALGAVRVIWRTELPIGCAGRGIATGDTVAAVGPSPSHRVANRDVHRVRHKLETISTSHHHIDSRAGSRWHPAHRWLAILIENADGRSEMLFL